MPYSRILTSLLTGFLASFLFFTGGVTLTASIIKGQVIGAQAAMNPPAGTYGLSALLASPLWWIGFSALGFVLSAVVFKFFQSHS